LGRRRGGSGGEAAAAAALTGTDFAASGRTAATMGIEGFDRAALLRRVRG
jgi:hypothetical protein